MIKSREIPFNNNNNLAIIFFINLCFTIIMSLDEMKNSNSLNY